MKPVSLIIAGAGNRGSVYAGYAAQHPDRASVVGVAEPRDFHRERQAAAHAIPARSVFKDWRDMAAQPRLADAVIIATQDRTHREALEAFAARGYHILLEKPMAADEESCRAIVATARAGGALFAVCHVMRYTSYTTRLKELLDSGALGDIVSIQLLEPVGFFHQAHSYVRGNWRNEASSSFMLLAKSCHDLDWIRYLMGRPCLRVSSFGSLHHFRPEERPEGAADRCLDCPVEPRCPYSAVRIYLGRVRAGITGWPVHIITPEPTEQSVLEALRDGPYGRCVYACDNDVVDNQVVTMEFAGARTASFTMTAFTEKRDRYVRIFATRGELSGDGEVLDVYDFVGDRHERIDTRTAEVGALSGHGGGDYFLMKAFVQAVATGDSSHLLSGPDDTLESHLMVFAAERARLEGRVVPVVL